MNITELFEILPGETEEEKKKELKAFLKRLSPEDLNKLKYEWRFWARPNQLAPSGDWVYWLLLAGRGFGKTRTGAEWVNERVQSGKARYVHLIAPTAADVRKTMVEGESGLLSVSPPGNYPNFEPSKLTLTWPNGAKAFLFSAEEPERLRGPQCDTIWMDEIAAWKKLKETYDMAMFGFRLGSNPQCVITTTPKPLPILKELLDKENTGIVSVTRGSTYENQSNLAPQFFASVVTKYEGTRLGRQELDAEILEDMPGALWNRTSIDANRIPGPSFPPIYREAGILPGESMEMEDIDLLKRAAQSVLDRVPEDLTRIVVAVDPNVSNNEGSDEIGITVEGRGLSGRGYVLADCSMRGSPNEWASAAVIAHDVFKADRVIGEANQGGNMVEYTLTTAAKALKEDGKRTSDFVGVTLVHATRGKVTRAEPASALYEQNRIVHVGTMTTLEDQMCLFTSDFDRKSMGYSPDRVDSLVWGLTHLFHEEQDGAGIFEFMKQEADKLRRAKLPMTPDNYIKMVAPSGCNAAYGIQGDKYRVIEGFVHVKPDDVPGLRNGGFIDA